MYNNNYVQWKRSLESVTSFYVGIVGIAILFIMYKTHNKACSFKC